MHRCLQIPEIVLQVVRQLEKWHKSTFLSLALTCRAFEDPALDELWRDPGTRTLEYILGCFPDDLLKITVGTDKFVVRLLRPVTLRDWERPLRYCNRVRKYDFGDSDGATQKYFAKYSDALTVLSVWLPGECLFPRLESLTWDIIEVKREAEAVNHIRLFLSPRLKKIQLARPTRLMLSLFPTIMQRGPPLMDVQIGRGTDDIISSVAERAAISAFVLSLDKLTRLVVPALDREAFYHLATLPGVTSLRLESLSPDGLSGFLPSTGTFPTLEDLSISMADMPTATRVLPLVSKSPLSVLRITPLPSASTAQVSAFYAALAAHIEPSFFRGLNHYYSAAAGDLVDTWKISRSSLLALDAFSGLTRLAMNSRTGYEIDEATLLSLVRGWPNLESLQLHQSIRETPFTLATLIPIAQHCRHLDYLRLTVDTTTIPSLHPSDSHGGERTTQEALGELHVGFSTLGEDDPFPIARFLTGLFPAMTDISYCWGYEPNEGTEIRDRWMEVDGLITKLREIREEERAWADYDVEYEEEEEEEDSVAQEEEPQLQGHASTVPSTSAA
ncbi:hypothetical protein C8F01DRAFT_1366780 [Mycena amicta]|nr:hypothetical protein C8F01DRAFT_1366780 [Mycena amicta]